MIRDNISFFKRVEARLARGRVRSACWEAEALVRHFSRMSRLELFTGERGISPAAKRTIERVVRSRVRGIPLQHLLKETCFFGHTFFVNAHVLIPRPETEILAEEALKIFKDFPQTPSVLDLGTGTGCLAASLTLARPDCRMTALDLSEKALRVARKNFQRHGLEKKIRLLKSDLFGRFKPGPRWDVIVSNPPYIPGSEIARLSREVRQEPRLALDGGRRGLDIIGRILEEAPRFLKAGGRLLMEIGDGQAHELKRRISKDGRYKSVRFVKDLTGIERVLVLEIEAAGSAGVLARSYAHKRGPRARRRPHSRIHG